MTTVAEAEAAKTAAAEGNEDESRCRDCGRTIELFLDRPEVMLWRVEIVAVVMLVLIVVVIGDNFGRVRPLLEVGVEVVETGLVNLVAVEEERQPRPTAT